MGTVIFLSGRRPAPSRARGESRRLSPAAEHIQQALNRYRRDLRLMLGREQPSPTNLDDLLILDRFRALRARRQFIGDRILRIKTLEAMLDLVLEGPEAVVLPVRRFRHESGFVTNSGDVAKDV